MTSYTGTALVDADTTYGLQLHHPRFLEFIGAPESARLLNNSPSFWVDIQLQAGILIKHDRARKHTVHSPKSARSKKEQYPTGKSIRILECGPDAAS